MYDYYTLPNGLRIVFRRTASPVTHAGVYINVGSRHEQGSNEGIAHFIEHSIFKGTEHRRAGHIRNRIDGVGGELDAFTTKEETCVYASVLTQHLERCLELFADILFHSTFPPHEIEKEKEVVIEEINLYKDSPSELIYDDFEERHFGTHPLGHNILGSKKNVRHFTSDALKQFMNRYYTPDRMVVSVVGNIEFKRLVHLCTKYFADADTSHLEPATPTPTFKPSPFNTSIHKHTHQVHLLAGCPAPTIYDSDKTAFTLLSNIIGGPAMNSRLNVAIREREGFCYTIESQYVPFTDAGMFYIYAGVDSEAADRSTQLILRELHNLCQTPLTPYRLKAAQQQMIGQLAINNDSGLNEMQSIGKARLNFDRVDTLDEMSRDLLALTPTDLLQTARRYLADENFSFLYYV